MESVLILGLLIGMQHALEADHVAAVSSIVARQRSPRRIVGHGVFWGIGHTVTLALFAGAAILFGMRIGDRVSGMIETGVGVMLVALGANVLYRLHRDRVHFHAHRHADGDVHLHAHSHAGEATPHDPAAHHHDHPAGLPLRSLLVGMMHGMAGSAALVLLTASTISSPAVGLLYIVLFGLGSVAGMAALSAAIAIPLAWSARALSWANSALQGAVGVGTMALGLFVIAENAGFLG